MAYEGRITGQNAIVKVDGNEKHVTNVSFDIDADTTEVQTNQGLKSRIATTSLTYSGSFEWDGSQDDVRDALLYDANDGVVTGDGPKEAGEPKRFKLTVKERVPDETTAANGPKDLRTWTIESCIMTSMSRDVPADDVPSTSIDFAAEDAYVSSGGDTKNDGGSRSTV